MKRYLLIIAVVVLITGCLPWARTGGLHVAPAQGISVDLPDGWMRLNTDDYLLVTRDGVLLEYIMVERIHVEDELTHTKKKFRTGMLSQEQAGVITDNISSNQDVMNFKVISNKPAKIAGHKGFKVVFTYRDTNKLKYKSIYYGFMEGELFYGVRYDAPLRHYYKKHLKTFAKVLGSLKLVKNQPSS